MWEYDTNDWKMSSGTSKDQVKQNYEKVINDAKDGKFDTAGTIVLTHEITGDTMDMFMEMYPEIKDNFDYIVPFYAATNTTNLYVETGDDVKKGQTFAEYVKDVYNGTSVEAATSTNSNDHPDPTMTGTAGALATVANPTVASIEGAAASDVTNSDDDDNSAAYSISGTSSLLSVAALMVSTTFVALSL